MYAISVGGLCARIMKNVCFCIVYVLSVLYVGVSEYVLYMCACVCVCMYVCMCVRVCVCVCNGDLMTFNKRSH